MFDDSEGLTKVHIDLPNHWWFSGESLWAQPLGNDLYEIRNIPFCAYGLNFGDVVRATADAPDQKPEIRALVRQSGNRTVRIRFEVAVGDRDGQLPHLERLAAMQAWHERANANIVCVNLNPDADYEAILDLLDSLEADGLLQYETCEARVEGSFDDAPEAEDTP